MSQNATIGSPQSRPPQ